MKRLGDCAEGELVRVRGVLRRVAGRMGDVVVVAAVLEDGRPGPYQTRWGSELVEPGWTAPRQSG